MAAPTTVWIGKRRPRGAPFLFAHGRGKPQPRSSIGTQSRFSGPV